MAPLVDKNQRTLIYSLPVINFSLISLFLFLLIFPGWLSATIFMS